MTLEPALANAVVMQFTAVARGLGTFQFPASGVTTSIFIVFCALQIKIYLHLPTKVSMYKFIYLNFN